MLDEAGVEPALPRVQGSRTHQGKAPYGVAALAGRPLADGRHLVVLDIDGAEGVAVGRRLLGPDRAPTMTYRTAVAGDYSTGLAGHHPHGTMMAATRASRRAATGARRWVPPWARGPALAAT